jgi:LmbE family N-acetylglucosaminyl deacetylase
MVDELRKRSLMDHPSGHGGSSLNGNGKGHGGHRRSVLAVGAHPDDIELGCGGALLAHRACGDAVSMLVMSKGELGPQDSQPRAAEQQVAARVLGAELDWGDFDDAAIPGGQETVAAIQDVMARVRPDVVYSHSPFDSHQDHRATASATLAAARRSSRILLYEAPSSLGFTPSLYVDISAFLEGKLEALRAHMSQVLRNGLVDLEAIEAQARYRGFQARIRLAEGFIPERFVWDVHRELTLAEPKSSLSAAMFREVS